MDIYDLLIKNGTLIDPESNTMIHGNVGINECKIAIITKENICGKREIDAQGYIVCPGFIDIHGHIDGHRECGELSVFQGVTTTIGGNCGFSPEDLKKFFVEQDKKGFPINQAQFIGHFNLRNNVGLTNPYIAATDFQIKCMENIERKLFEEGAIGLSFGLEYAPGASFEEVIALSSIAAKYKKLVAIHTRLDGPDDLDSLKEAVKIAEITGAAVQISHFVYQYGTGIMTEALEIVDDARKNGLNVWVDSGMYTDFATSIGTSVFDEDHIKKFNWKFNDMLVSTGKYKGERLTEKLYKELRDNYKNETIVCFTGVEDEIYEVLLKDYVMLSSDIGPSPSGNRSEGHPQNAGTFPRFFRKMVREQKSISLIKAIEKCTLLPAKVLGLTSKGRLKEGLDADIVIFDIETISDKSDFLGKGKPDAKPEGIHYVIVNGTIVVEDGDIIDEVLPGKPIIDK
ncbi:N-acyl-D-amino-acid deacylase family protein [Clostridium sp. JS66]|uniref:N-acyl-D-amino-acid deacylase family protein n=1 Tax=Clostridium sp. JS66 TaxID=3064705 RepID=UPI00298E4AA1|nr:amidohydrolase family protein [Clostridium sp. JS66]WPC43004.1 amidohydrolase family protein [Clostridium sp. JS66]